MARDLSPPYPSIGPPGVVSIYGSELVVEQPGDVLTDIYGLETCTTIMRCPCDRFDLVPAMFSPHPYFTYLNMERRRVSISEGYLMITGEFAGVQGTSLPVYELSFGLSDEPIESHINFVNGIGGKPSDPLNGAVFIDPSNGEVTQDDAVGVFDHFIVTSELAGVSSYLEACQLTWRQRYVTEILISDASSVGRIQGPAGPAPGIPSGGNWLYVGLNYEQRGNCFFVTKEWRASGRRGWNSLIYG